MCCCPKSHLRNNLLFFVVCLLSRSAGVSITAAGTYYGGRSECASNVYLAMKLSLSALSLSLSINLACALYLIYIGCCSDQKMLFKVRKCLDFPAQLYIFSSYVYMCVQVFKANSSNCDDPLWGIGLAFCIIGFVEIIFAVLYQIKVECCSPPKETQQSKA